MTHASLNTAFDRLTNAISRLDTASAQIGLRQSASALSQVQATAELNAEWERRIAAAEAEAFALREENESLKNDNLRLGNQLQELQQDYLELQQTASGIVGKLDGSIKQLDMMLEH